MARVFIPEKVFREKCAVGKVTAWRWRKNGSGPAWARMGARIMYDLDAVESFMEERLKAAAGEHAKAAE